MKFVDLVGFIRTDLSDTLFLEIRSLLYDQCVPFYLVNEKDVTPDLLTEKICDYFEKVKFNTGRSLDEMIVEYSSTLDEIMSDRIMKYENNAEKGKTKSSSRAWKYYEKARELRKGCNEKQALIDYSRIMMCLYIALQRDEGKPIYNFDFSVSALDMTILLSALRKEKHKLAEATTEAGKRLKTGIKNFLSTDDTKIIKNDTRIFEAVTRRKRFPSGQPYEKNSCTLVIFIIMYYMLKAEANGGENDA